MKRLSTSSSKPAMTKQHKATPEQWDDAGAFAKDTRACLFELRARIEALEACDKEDANCWSAVRASMHALRERVEALEATQSPSPSADRMLALQDQIRDGELTLTDALKEIGGKTTIRPLVEGVATDAELCQAYTDGPEHPLRAVYDLGRQHGAAAEVAPIVVPISPAESLVRRVAGVLPLLAGFDNWEDEARAAILEVADAALQMHPDKNLTWERVALWLEQEADQ